MCDCLWFAIMVCNGDCKCKNYLSMNAEDGQILTAQWGKIVDGVLKQHAIRFAEANGYEGGDENV